MSDACRFPSGLFVCSNSQTSCECSWTPPRTYSSRSTPESRWWVAIAGFSLRTSLFCSKTKWWTSRRTTWNCISNRTASWTRSYGSFLRLRPAPNRSRTERRRKWLPSPPQNSESISCAPIVGRQRQTFWGRGKQYIILVKFEWLSKLKWLTWNVFFWIGNAFPRCRSSWPESGEHLAVWECSSDGIFGRGRWDNRRPSRSAGILVIYREKSNNKLFSNY